jgi:hypothetical protein
VARFLVRVALEAVDRAQGQVAQVQALHLAVPKLKAVQVAQVLEAEPVQASAVQTRVQALVQVLEVAENN